MADLTERAIARMDEIASAPTEDQAASEPKESQASLLVAFVQERAELFHDENKDAFATLHDSGLTLRLDGRALRDWLSAGFYEAHDKAPRDQSVREALQTLGGLARHRGERRQVSLRIAEHEGYLIDLCEQDQSRAVHLTPGHWGIVDRPSARFVRTEAMQSIPAPIKGGNLDALWSITNVPDDKRVLVAAWLIECLRPDTPFPLLELIGEAGSAKSTTQTALRRLIDPNACDLRSPPKATEDAFVTAGVNWLVSYENVSHLSAPMQDALCVLATGGGFAKRKLYSDADEAVIQAKRPVILNGISACVTAHDLVDRAVSIELPVIQDRQESGGLWEQFENDRPTILGGLLDIAAKALPMIPRIQIPADERPRMIEFAKLGIAVGKVMGLDFNSAFNATRKDAVQRSIESSPVIGALVEWFDSRHADRIDMTVGALLEEVERFKPQGAEAWPRSSKGFGDALRRAAPSLRMVGIECRSLGRIGGNVRWEVARGKFANPSPECPEVLAMDDPEQDFRTCRTSLPELSPAGVSDEVDL